MSENKMKCPNCKETLDKINIDYVASINRSFNVEGKVLYWNTFEDQTSIDDVYMIYCSKCNSELPKEMRDEINGFIVEY